MSGKCCYRSAIVIDFTERVTYHRCPVHGETEHVYQPPKPLTLRRRWRLYRMRRRFAKFLGSVDALPESWKAL